MPLKKAGSIISIILIVILSLLLAAVLVMKLIFHAEMKTVLSGSMEPDLPVGSVLLIIPAEYDDINIGDDITFVRDESLKLVTHRVIEKNDDEKTITTKGIANNTRDAPTSYENVVGKVRLCIPLVGNAVLWLSSPKGIIITVTAIVSLIILSLLIRYLFLSKPENETEEKKTESCDDEKNEGGGNAGE